MRFCRQKHFKQLCISPSPFPYFIRVLRVFDFYYLINRVNIVRHKFIDEKDKMAELGL